MIVRLRVVGVQSSRLSPPGDGGFSRLELADGSTVEGLIAHLGPDEPDHLAVFLNNEQVAENSYGETVLREGDELVLLRPIDGGAVT